MESNNKFNENIENRNEKDIIINKFNDDQKEDFLNIVNNNEDKIKKEKEEKIEIKEDKKEEEKIEEKKNEKKKDEQDNDKIKSNNNIKDINNKNQQENLTIYNISDFDYNEDKESNNINEKEKNGDNKLNDNNDNKLNQNLDNQLNENNDNKLNQNGDNKLNENNDNKLNQNVENTLNENNDNTTNRKNDNKTDGNNDNTTNENNDNKTNGNIDNTLNENEEEISTSKKKENEIELNKNNITTKPITEYELNINHILKYIKSHYNYSYLFKLEYFINICISYENLSKNDKINYYNQLLKIKYSKNEKNGILMLSQFFYKLYKNDNKDKLRILIRSFYRIAKYLNDNKYFSLSNKFSEIAQKLIQDVNYRKYHVAIMKILQKNDKYFERYCDNLKKKFIEILDDKLNELTQIFNNIENEMNNSINENNIFVISKIWFLYTNHFLKVFIEKRNKQEDLKSFIEKSIEPRFLIEFEEIIKSFPVDSPITDIAIIPGLINNFNLINFKDFWKEKSDDENYVLKKDLEFNKDYILINENNWNILSDFFGYIFKVTNKYKYIKCLLLHNKLKKEDNNYSLIKKGYISIEKDSTIRNLKEKIYKCIIYETEKIKQNVFLNENENINNENKDNIMNSCLLNIFTLKKNSNILFEIIPAYKSDLPSISNPNLEQIKLLETSSINELPISKDNILIFEILENNQIPFLQMPKNICLICNKPLTDYSCSKCHLQEYCSRNCLKSSIKHLTFHKSFEQLLFEKFSLEKLFKKSLEDILPPNGNKGIIGLYNLGNTCFMNSAIQCLSNTEDLTKYCLYNCYDQEINYNNRLGSHGQLIEEYVNLIKKLWISENEEKKPINPYRFRVAVARKIPQFIPLIQQDSHEFLSLFLDNIHEDLNRISNKPYIEIKEQQINESDLTASNRWWDYHKSRENSIITDLFHGQFKNIITCPDCGKKVINYDPFMFLGLSIPSINYIIKVKVLYKRVCYFINSSIFDNTRLCVIKELALNNIPELESFKDINLIEGILLDKNKMICKFFNDEDSNNEILFHFCQKGYEICLYVKESVDYFNLYIYPAKFEKNDKKLPNILSYPLAIPVKMNSTLEEFSNLVNHELDYLLMKNNQNEGKIEILIYHYNLPSGMFSSTSCRFCNKSHNISNQPICHIFETFNKTNTIKDLFNYQKNIKTNQKIIILFGESNQFNKDVSVYLKLKNSLELSKNDELFKKVEKLSLYNCLDLFRNEERLEEEDMWYCSNCKESKRALKKMDIYKPSNYLIIQFKRFKIKSNTPVISFFLNKKIDSFIEFPINELDLRNYVIGPEKNQAIYDLYGIIEHSGGLSMGHYIAICKNSNTWINYNDSIVSIRKDKNVVTKNAYILFYKKRLLNNE